MTPDAIQRKLVGRRFVAIIAVTGLVVSFLMHLATFAHYNPANQFTLAVLFAGLAVVWTATIPVWRRLGFSPRQVQFAPEEVRYPSLLLAGYLIFTMFTVEIRLRKEGARADVHGHTPVPGHYMARVLTAGFMLFYGFVVATQKADKSR